MDGELFRIGLALGGVVICLVAFTIYMRWHYATRHRRMRDDGES